MISKGIQIITEERERQIKEEGWTPEHDAEHVHNEMAIAAAAYAMPSQLRNIQKRVVQMKDEKIFRVISSPKYWPWDIKWWKPTPNDRIRELAKAGALIAAEIDRLLAADKNTEAMGILSQFFDSEITTDKIDL